jgi:CheY-like chemotaxis protein
MSQQSALVVDDSKSARFALRKFLEQQGYAVDTAEGAAEAYGYLKSHRPSIIFLDHLMPGVDGFDALRTIRRDPACANIPVIICSSNEGDDFVREARAQGASDVLPKPPMREHIERVIVQINKVAANSTPAGPTTATAAAAPGPAAAPAPTAMPPAPAKVQPIREPEVAIQQAVMKTLREAMPQAAAPSPAAAAAPGVAAPLSAVPAAATSAPPTGLGSVPARSPHTDLRQLETMREEFEGRMRHITQDLYAQFGELRAQIAHIGASVASHGDEHMASVADEAVRSQMDGISSNLQRLFDNLRADVEAAIDAQNRNIEAIARSIREAAAEEAHAVAERVVMNAAVRISDQMAESFLRVLRQAHNQANAA